MSELTHYEQQQLQRIDAWRRGGPGAATRTIRKASAAASQVVQNSVPGFILRKALELVQGAAERLAGRESVLRMAGVNDLSALRSGRLEVCDRLELSTRRRALLMAGGSGTVLGFAGAPGMAADITSLLVLTFRTIHRIGLCYGEDCTGQRRVTLAIFAIASANTIEEKYAALQVLDSEEEAHPESWREGIERATERELAKSAAQLSLNNLARQFTRRLGWRLSGGVLPVLGAAIGGGVNAWYLREVAQAARHSFQLRWLHARYPQLRQGPKALADMASEV